jgi:hypothetical protein
MGARVRGSLAGACVREPLPVCESGAASCFSRCRTGEYLKGPTSPRVGRAAAPSMALVFSDPSEPDAVMEPSVTHMRCSSCKLLKPCCACEQGQYNYKEPSAFPKSCARWRRGVCKQCRASKAKSVPLMKRKLDSARRCYGSNNR